MLLRAQAVGEHPSVRFVILNVRSNLMWDGESFVDDFDQARKYWHPSDACADMQDILREHYGQLRQRRFVVPVEIEVYGSVSQKEIAEYLYRASVLKHPHRRIRQRPSRMFGLACRSTGATSGN